MRLNTLAQIALTGALLLSTGSVSAVSQYNCSSVRPEAAGLHNMVLFGDPGEELYTYHLPLFAGSIHGMSGHVLMHVYQGLWRVQIDPGTKRAYDLRFAAELTASNPFPFFSVGPQGNRFKVPEMICSPGFSFQAAAVFGHIEGNPAFPVPDQLTSQLATVTALETVFARRFDGTGRSELTYLLFGGAKQHYMMHVLTDDQSSFDQIVGVEIKDSSLRALVASQGSVLVTVPLLTQGSTGSLPVGLAPVAERAGQTGVNHIWKLSVSPLGQSVGVVDSQSGLAGQVKILGEVYFNANEDLQK